MKVAIFDFDGTIYKNETYSFMMDFLKTHEEYNGKYKSFYYSIVPPYVGYKLRLYPERRMKASLTQKYLNVFHGLKFDKVKAYFEELAAKMRDDFHPLVLEQMEEHEKKDHLIMVVSGTYKPLLEAALEYLPVDIIIGTDIPTNNHIVDAKMPIDHVQADRKAELILEKLKHKAIDWKNSFAYGDSISDLPVFEMVGNPVAVCPDVKLQQIANRRNWKVIC